MSTGTKILIGICAVIIVLCAGIYAGFKNTYNSMVVMNEQVDLQWAQVQNVYQRRMDLIPNLVAAVQGAAAHESKTLTDVAEARSKAGGTIALSADMLSDPAAFDRFQQAQGELTGALQRLISVTEQYPELQANQNFLMLQDQLEGTENRISVERKRFNEHAAAYNAYIKQFPRVVIAQITGFSRKPYFKAADGAETAPAVSF